MLIKTEENKKKIRKKSLERKYKKKLKKIANMSALMRRGFFFVCELSVDILVC